MAVHPKATLERRLKGIQEKIRRFHLQQVFTAEADDRRIVLNRDDEMLKEAGKLDGCYVLKTDLPAESISKEIIYNRYKDLSKVEWAFRTSKTGKLDMRPIFVRTEASTRGHVLVVMLAYQIIQALAKKWSSLNITVEEGIAELETLCTIKIFEDGKDINVQRIPKPAPEIAELLKALNIIIPEVIVSRNIIVSSRKDLAKKRQGYENKRVKIKKL